MATSPSEAGEPEAEPGPRIEVVAGGPASPVELAAILAALDRVLGERDENSPVSPWRWSGRSWARPPGWGGWRRRPGGGHTAPS